MAEEARLESVYTSKAYPEFESRSLRPVISRLILDLLIFSSPNAILLIVLFFYVSLQINDL